MADEHETGTDDRQEPQAASGGPDVAEENRRRMREALAHKRGAAHPDDAARRTGGVRGSAPLPGGRDFTRRRSG